LKDDNTIRKSLLKLVRMVQQESRAVAGNPRDAAVIFDP